MSTTEVQERNYDRVSPPALVREGTFDGCSVSLGTYAGQRLRVCLLTDGETVHVGIGMSSLLMPRGQAVEVARMILDADGEVR